MCSVKDFLSPRRAWLSVWTSHDDDDPVALGNTGTLELEPGL